MNTFGFHHILSLILKWKAADRLGSTERCVTTNARRRCNNINSIHLARKYVPIFLRQHCLFREANRFS